MHLWEAPPRNSRRPKETGWNRRGCEEGIRRCVGRRQASFFQQDQWGKSGSLAKGGDQETSASVESGFGEDAQATTRPAIAHSLDLLPAEVNSP